MNTKETTGQAMHDADAQRRSEAARAMGSARTARKSQASRHNITQVNQRKQEQGVSEETRAKLRVAQAARRERERLAKEAAGESAPVKEKKAVGRPRTHPEGNEAAKRPVGRPRKHTGQTTLETE